MADGFGIDQLEALIDQRMQQGYGFDPSRLNDAAQEILRTIEKIYDRTASDPSGLSAKEINSAMKEIRDFLKSSGATTKETATYISNWTNELKGLIKSGITLDKSRFQHSANANISNMMSLNVLDPSKKSAQGNVLAQTLQKGYGRIEKKMDSIIEKLLYLCNMEDKKAAKEEQKEGQEGKKKRQFIDDLIEGLARSKFVGGAFTDLVRLATFFAASWLKNHGLLGKALAVGLVALGPVIGTAIANILTKALVSGITNVLKTGLLSLGTLLKATFMSFFNRAALQGALSGTGAPIAGISRGNLALGAGLAAVGLGAAAHHEWKEGRKGSAVAFGVGSAGFGVAGIASLITPLLSSLIPALAPFLAPIAPIALAVAAVATGIGLIIKFWPQITEFFRGVMEKLGIIAKKEEDEGGGYYKEPSLVEKVQNIVSGKGAEGSTAELLSGKTDSGKDNKGHFDPTKMSHADWERANTLEPVYGKMGEIVNLGQMSKKRAQEVIALDIKKKGEKSYYEEADPSLVNIAAFRTDLTNPEGTRAYMARGWSARRRADIDKFKAAGYTSTNNDWRITSGIASIGNEGDPNRPPHTYSTKWWSHYSSYGLTYDAPIMYKDGKRVTAKDLNKLGIGYYLEEDIGKANEHGHYAQYKLADLAERELKDTIQTQEGQALSKEVLVEAAKKNLELAEKATLDYVMKTDKDLDETVKDPEYIRLDTEESKARSLLKNLKKGIYEEDLNSNGKIEKNEKQKIDFTSNEATSKILQQLHYYSTVSPGQQ